MIWWSHSTAKNLQLGGLFTDFWRDVGGKCQVCAVTTSNQWTKNMCLCRNGCLTTQLGAVACNYDLYIMLLISHRTPKGSKLMNDKTTNEYVEKSPSDYINTSNLIRIG